MQIEHLYKYTVASENRGYNIKNTVTLRFVKPLNLNTKEIFVYLVISKKLKIKEICKIFYFLLKITKAKSRDKII